MTTNRSSRVVLKQRHKNPYAYKTEVKNREHIRYIATRSGAVVDSEAGHGLFGKISGMEQGSTIPDLQAVMKYVFQKSKEKTVMYRATLSFREEDAQALGLVNNRKAWEDLMNTHMAKFAAANRIPVSRFEWVAATHMEKGHPHMHICYWDKQQPVIKNPFVSPSVLNKVRIEIMKEVFEDELQSLFSAKTDSRNAIRMQGADFFNDFDEALEGMNDKEYEDLKSKVAALSKEHNLTPISFSKIADKRLLFLANELMQLKKVLPKSGSLKYGFLTTDVKQAVDEVTLKLLSASKDLSSAFNAYIQSNVALAEFYTSNTDSLSMTKDKAYKEALKMLGNRVLNEIKLINTKEWEVKSNVYKQECTKELLFSLFSILSTDSQQNDSKVKYIKQRGDLSKSAKRELAKEMESKGIDWG